MSWDILERAHVITIPGGVFGAAGEGFLRLSYGAAPADALREGMLRLRRYLADG
jgi:aspartate/methionine/tyrosine aminotransferase